MRSLRSPSSNNSHQQLAPAMQKQLAPANLGNPGQHAQPVTALTQLAPVANHVQNALARLKCLSNDTLETLQDRYNKKELAELLAHSHGILRRRLFSGGESTVIELGEWFPWATRARPARSAGPPTRWFSRTRRFLRICFRSWRMPVGIVGKVSPPPHLAALVPRKARRASRFGRHRAEEEEEEGG
ncbi:hypothetical protein IMZ48_12965, partial [Candidatus Bathyarchaeota archaeon]|nr:hypothetical protein [Candidatus Bathyarchaeota archaeon]